ncbi:hypothetical protein GIB67_019522 [Kingdonia uniflora]|uniref:Dof zinc finger protein n=1 Tax=Kingdonia uniflora TaxID=39325 RepID=A0A7J7N0Q7_9MAGN|nr:hypothetical protein GIB67_019522 [Kingdonia uniflora]
MSTPTGKSASGKVGLSSLDFIKPTLGFDHDLYHHAASNPILWASPQKSHPLALLRSIPNPNPNSVSIKEEGNMTGARSMSGVVPPNLTKELVKMIQELFGGGGAGLLGERKVSMNGVAPSSGETTAPPQHPPPPPDQQNLRCPRCDSSNTKFCYYNNYNLTQPRHFCKTCRRYWTKGGALRNVPIGGGCRKSKTNIVPTPAGKSTSGKVRLSPSDFIKPTLGFDNDLYHRAASNPILWASPQNSHLLALLRSTPNPNPNPNSISIKEEGNMIGARLMSGEDPLSMWRNPQQQHQSLLHGDDQHSGGIQDLYQRLRSSANYYTGNDHLQAGGFNNVAPISSASSTVLDPSPISGGELGYWNPSTLSWPNLPATTNGAYP